MRHGLCPQTLTGQTKRAWCHHKVTPRRPGGACRPPGLDAAPSRSRTWPSCALDPGPQRTSSCLPGYVTNSPRACGCDPPIAKETSQRGKVKDFETGEILPDYPGTLSAITRVPCRSKAKGDLTAEGGGHGQEKQDAVLPALKTWAAASRSQEHKEHSSVRWKR